MPSPSPFDRDTLIAAITRFLTGLDPELLCAVRQALEREIDLAGPSALAALAARLTLPAADWSYYEADPLARRIHHAIADRLLDPDSTLLGVEYAGAVGDRPVVIVANHLSYSDANLLEVLLHRGGASALAGRLTVVAGPKVYASTRRRFSSLCFGTISVPQSSARSSEDAVMNPRDVARGARRSIAIAHARLQLGEALLVFAEGARSRTAEMQPMLAAASRYLDRPGTWVLPAGITGTEAMFPVGEDRLYPSRIVAALGAPISADDLRAQAGGDRRLTMDAIGVAIASLLPATYRGVYGRETDFHEARAVLAALQPAVSQLVRGSRTPC